VLTLLLSIGGMAHGDSTPGFDLPRLQGNEKVSLADLRDKVVYLDFWASWCGPCRESLPLYEQMASSLAGQPFVLIAINLDENRDDAQRFLQNHPVSYSVLSDPAGLSAADWQIKAMPTSFLLDRDGTIVRQWAGFRPSHIEDIENEIRALLE